ncbi:hypothetical protein [Allokutzneria sp. NRRL B-24872]|uniref:hypothetical protein n=1 Tax=Allokutzneria sp. NRRL B-24872 TaxID=1137961 RepID=UPI000A3BAF1A|nr:hypothetical protein [Allokutzneria sp. NRRL B-24872]
MRATLFLIGALVLAVSGCGANAQPNEPAPSPSQEKPQEKPPTVTVAKGQTGEVALKVGEVISVPPSEGAPLVKDAYVRLHLQADKEWQYRAISPGKTKIPTSAEGASVTVVIS